MPPRTSKKAMNPDPVLRYWLDELGPKGWYASSPEIDAEILARFETLWGEAMAGGLMHWLTNPEETLAYIILTDQMSRNMFRGTWRAYSSDHLARAATHIALDRGWDLRIDEPQRQFFYLPLEHSECLADQDRAVRLMALRLNDAENLLHAQAHREVIRRFGRFPFRNDHLQRRGTEAEQEFVAQGGYSTVVNALKAA
jgi:uncharacterized protein (DUF924 family)